MTKHLPMDEGQKLPMDEGQKLPMIVAQLHDDYATIKAPLPLSIRYAHDQVHTPTCSAGQKAQVRSPALQQLSRPALSSSSPPYTPAMTWIDTIGREAAEPRLRETYDRIAGKNGTIDNILLAHSLRPHTLTGHLALYKAVLHHSGNSLPVSFLETIGVLVSHLNGCAYCVDHHAAGLRSLLDDDARHSVVLRAVRSGRPEEAFDGRELAALRYTRMLTESPGTVSEADVQLLRTAGFDDGEILEINQVTAYFAYANRTVLGLGITTDGDDLGTAPPESDDVTEWRHG